MPDPITERLAILPSLNKGALSKMWKELFNSSPPPQLRRDLMVPILGYRLQEQALGSLTSRGVSRLRELAACLKTRSDLGLRLAPAIKPGTRLIRQWQSQTHVVHAEEQGYEYKGHCYGSLSEIARLITGTRRSGPLFFGLKGKQTGNTKEAA